MRHKGKRPTPVQRELRRIAEAIEQNWVLQGEPGRVLDYFNVLGVGCCCAAYDLGLIADGELCAVQRFVKYERGMVAPPGILWSERILWLYLLAEAGEEVAYR